MECRCVTFTYMHIFLYTIYRIVGIIEAIYGKVGVSLSEYM